MEEKGLLEVTTANFELKFVSELKWFRLFPETKCIFLELVCPACPSQDLETRTQAARLLGLLDVGTLSRA